RAGARLGDLEENSPRLFGSIAQVARTNTHFLDGPNMRKVLETSTVSLESLKRSAKGETLYLCLPQRYMDTHYRWLRMMVTLTVTAAERDPYQPRSGHPVLMMLDEFPALKRMRVLENAAAQIAGYGVKLSFVVQTLAQLKDLYKDNWETFVANSGIKLFSCNDDHFTRDYVSKLIGDEDVVLSTATGSKSEGRSESYGYGSSSTSSGGTSWSSGSNGQPVVSTNSGWSHTSTHNRTYGRSSTETHGYSSSIHKRPLLAPDEVGRAFGNRNNPKALVLLSGHQPVAVHRTLYYREPVMAGYYGWHPNHARPATIAAIHAQRDLEARKQAEADASEAAALKRQRDERERRRLKEENEKKREELRENRKDLIYTVVMAAMTFVLVVRMIHDKFFQ
ncbi:MAG: type IV secretory system conjugative DNA transfer family protein, partial [Thermomicrobiales bacterium]